MREPLYFPQNPKDQRLSAEETERMWWAGRRVLVVGLARSGVAAAKLLCARGAFPVLNDLKPLDAFKGALDELCSLPCEWRLGEPAESLLDGLSAVIISPGVPIDAPVVHAARACGIPVMGELEFASRLARGFLVAVTGTNGKTTTVTLLGELFKAAGRLSHVSGNVGYPLSAAVLESGSEDVLAVEVSSFQLESIERFHPEVAVVLNITEDHLNRHGTMNAYIALKKSIFKNQTSRDIAVLNRDDPLCAQLSQGLSGRVAWFSRAGEVEQGAFVRDGWIVIRWDGTERLICATEEIYIPGAHNLENALAASLSAYVSGVPAAVIHHVLRTFKGVEHRIEFVRDLNGVRWYNDSKGTNVDSTIKAIETMRAPSVWLAGGSDKHVSFDALAQAAVKSGQILHTVLIGQTAPQIDAALRAAGYSAITHEKSLADAVNRCRALAVSGGNVLFSPACASFDMFTDYEERGRIFKDLVHALS